MNTQHHKNLPQLNGQECLTDGGLETCLIFHEGFNLPLFAAFPLLNSIAGRAALDRYIRRFAAIARRDGKGFIMDTPTWRASKRWADELNFTEDELRQVHVDSVASLKLLRDELETSQSPFLVNGAIGPQDDGYNPQHIMTVDEAEAYHAKQVGWFAEFGADMVSAITMTYVKEAIGITKAAQKAGIPVVIAFTVETDGRLPSGQPLGEAITQVDTETGAAPAYFMINCAHPDHFSGVLAGDVAWKKRIMGVRANASRMSHEELDNAEELDAGDPQELGGQYRDLKALLPNLAIFGGCCGTDHRHIDAISHACNHKQAA